MRKKIKKRDFEFEAYPIGTQVYAISIWRTYDDTDHLAIYEAIVKDINFSALDGLEYWLESKDGEHWKDVCKAENVSEDFDDLLDVAKKIWKHGA